MMFFLGTHLPWWLGKIDIPLFISQRTLGKRKRLPRATGPWALDSGGFTELNTFGRWETSPSEYVSKVRRYIEEVGMLEWAAAQDWMCEPFVLAKTGKTVAEHQALTIWNYLDLLDRGPDLPWAPVIQGWSLSDYERHMDEYDCAGIRLADLPIVGLGSVCRRQNTVEASRIVRAVRRRGIRIHGFGFKTTGLLACADAMASADSLAWSYGERRKKTGLANNMGAALRWRDRLLKRLDLRDRQGTLPGLERSHTEGPGH